MASKTERVLSLYSRILKSVDLTVDEQGQISYEPPGAVDKENKPLVMPANVAGKRWVLPTREVLDLSPWEACIPFHPLSENFINEESESFTKLKAVMNIKLNAVMAEVMARLVDFAADSERHGQVPAKASKFLRLVPNIKQISAKRMWEIVERVNDDRRLINIYLKKGGNLDGTAYAFAAMVTFPFRTELEGTEPRAFGVTISKQDQVSFKALFDYILPDNDTLSTYSVGSSSHTAPRFEALLRAFAAVAERLNEVIALHKKLLPSYDDLTIELDWVDELSHLRALSDVIPPLIGNIGTPVKDRKATTGAKASPAASTMATGVSRVFASKAPDAEVRREGPTRPMNPASEQASIPNQPAVATVSDDRPDSQLSFRERMERQQERERKGRQYAGAQGGTGARVYRAAEPGVPEWATRLETTGTIGQVAGDVQGYQLNDQRGRYAGGAPEPGSFQERMARQAGSGAAYYGGGNPAPARNYGGGGNYGGGRFQL